MPALALSLTLLASSEEFSKLRALRAGFNRRHTEDQHVVLVVILAVAICGLIAMLVQMISRWRQKGQNPRNQLERAIRAVGLGRTEAGDVRRLASRAGLSQPTAMLLSPGNLAHALRLPTRQHDQPELRAQVEKLSVTLLGTHLPHDGII